jgi:beta-glucosidase
MTFNEAPSLCGMGYIFGVWPPEKRSLRAADKALKNINNAHKLIYELAKEKFPEIKIGVVLNLKHHAPYDKNNILDRMLAKADEYLRDTRYLKPIIKKADFIGVNYYFHDRLHFKLGGSFFGLAQLKNPNDNLSDMGSDISPEGIYHVLKRITKHNLPIYITENGLADKADTRREKFIKDHLLWVHKAISEGVDVRGYFYWSILDNFEWDKGFWPRFGLVEIDYKTMERKIRPSAWEYAKICKNNEMEI